MGLFALASVVIWQPLIACHAVLPLTTLTHPMHRLGEACQILQTYPVSFTMNANGELMAMFALAGGSARGRLLLPDIDRRTLNMYDVYTTDVRLGSYEPPNVGNDRSALTCRVNPTFHFYCPVTGFMDQFCLIWLRARNDGGLLARPTARLSRPGINGVDAGGGAS